jgi:hypothetical protein
MMAEHTAGMVCSDYAAIAERLYDISISQLKPCQSALHAWTVAVAGDHTPFTIHGDLENLLLAVHVLPI